MITLQDSHILGRWHEMCDKVPDNDEYILYPGKHLLRQLLAKYLWQKITPSPRFTRYCMSRDLFTLVMPAMNSLAVVVLQNIII